MKSIKKFFVMAVLTSVAVSSVLANSVKSVMLRAREGKSLNVVFFGGSLTWGANASDPNVTSWRGLTMQELRKRYPQASWQFKDSAIGGTGSMLAVFRMERDVFKYNPDLVILDFTLNDGLKGGSDGLHNVSNQSYEAIIRECVRRNVAVLPVFTVSKANVEELDINILKRRNEHIELFKRYNLEYADILGLMHQAHREKQIDISKFWPIELFDRVHPHDAGYAAYRDFFFREWERIEAAPEKKPVLTADFISGKSFSNLLRVDLPQLELPGWRVCYPCVVSDCYDWLASRHLDKLVMRSNAEQTGATTWEFKGDKIEPFTFKVKAERVGAMIETLPESVPFSISVDGKEPVEIKVRQVLRSQLHFVNLAYGLTGDKWHTITIIPENPADNKPGVIRFGAILLNGKEKVEFSL